MTNKNDLISREAAIKGLLSMCPEKTEPGSFDEYGVTVLCGAVDVVIKGLPAVDAVPVVRCKDCKHWHMGLCCCNDIYTGKNHYCADGERRENDADG